jgi:hypothetical protein
MVGWATSRFHDVGYEALVADPSARWSGGMAGWAWRCRPRGQRMIRWIGRHHHRGRGRPHRYSLADFGLEPAVVDRRFARSREWVSAVTLS